jgi:hypothetical protein
MLRARGNRQGVILALPHACVYARMVNLRRGRAEAKPQAQRAAAAGYAG